MRASVKAGPVGFEAGGSNDVLLIAGLLVGGYFFLTRQVLPDAGRAVVSAGGLISDGANAAANKAAQILTGNPNATTGTAAYELTHPWDRAGAIATAPSVPIGRDSAGRYIYEATAPEAADAAIYEP